MEIEKPRVATPRATACATARKCTVATCDHYSLSEGRRPRVLRTKETGIEIRPGDCLEVRSSGGGGWGPPAKRSAAAREHDRDEGLVTTRRDA